jgi:methylmalonyl-CoA/ethylmalonyl-CoA epimerase
VSLENFGLRFHHFGLAVTDTAAGRKVLEGMGYRCGDEIHDPLQEVQLVWCSHLAMPAVELVAPTDKPGPLDNIAEDNTGNVYHLCYSADDIEASIESIKAAGIRVMTVAPPKPAVLFGGKTVGFYQVKGFGLIEIVEEPPAT